MNVYLLGYVQSYHFLRLGALTVVSLTDLSPPGVVSCPPHVRLPVRNGLVNEVEFLGLIPQNGEDQRDCKIANYYVALPYNI